MGLAPQLCIAAKAAEAKLKVLEEQGGTCHLSLWEKIAGGQSRVGLWLWSVSSSLEAKVNRAATNTAQRQGRH